MPTSLSPQPVPAPDKRLKPHSNERPPHNPLHRGIKRFLIDHPDLQSLFPDPLPKRYTVHPPLLLLPSSPPWPGILTALPSATLHSLSGHLLSAFAPQLITHIALNAPIPLHFPSLAPDTERRINDVRSPAGLVPIHGDFGGPCTEKTKLSHADLSTTLWVRAPSPEGVPQVYAPLYTMFSRGNAREKARILGRGASPGKGMEGLDGLEGRLGQRIEDIAVVDMYVGVGYFAFCYLGKGVGRVWGWDINAWSIEGARRGAEDRRLRNRIFEGDEEENEGTQKADQIMHALQEDARLILFHEDNEKALRTLKEARRSSEGGQERAKAWKDIRHVNLGLLPTSRKTWETAVQMLDKKKGGWVHAHENVDVTAIEQRRGEVEAAFQRFSMSGGIGWSAVCEHVEEVKTYAPGVMHCVFDIHVAPREARKGN